MTARQKQPTGEELERRWSNRRQKLPINVLRAVYVEAGHKCANPTCRFSLLLEAHHILWVKDGGGDTADNLLALCANCHGMHTRDLIGYDAIWHWKQMLVMLNQAYDKHSINQLLYLHKTANAGIRYEGGDVERFAALISTGVAAVTNTWHRIESGIQVLSQGNAVGMAVEARFCTSVHTVELTDKGRMLVEAWLSADHKKYEECFCNAIADHVQTHHSAKA